MIDFKKLDRADLWIASDPLTPEQEKAFSEFLKTRRVKPARIKSARSIPSARKKHMIAAK
jgi:membrane-bound lytic murein transglycosylase B